MHHLQYLVRKHLTDTQGTMAAPKTYNNLIDGEWVPSRSGQTFENLNPADTRDVVGIFQRSNKEDVDAAVAAAKRAWESWRLVPAPRRAEIIFRAGEILLERKEQYAKDMTREMGKVLSETRGDVQEAVDTAYYMAGEGRRLFGQTVPSELPNKFAMSIRQPVGVCGMITPWNFPMAIPSWKLFPALVCGNTCIIKPAEDTPLSTINLVRALLDAGLPKGVVNIVTGEGPDVGSPLVQHKDVRAISFTGSSEVGRIVGPEGAKLRGGGNRLTVGEHQHGWFFEPTVFGDVTPTMRIAQEEIFGPVVSVLRCRDFDEALEIANGVQYGLSSSLYTRDVNKAF